MKIIVNLESGDRLAYFLDRKQVVDPEQLLKQLQALLKEDFPKKYVLFSACKQTDPEPIKILKSLREITNEYQPIYMYSTQTLLKLTNCTSLWTFRSDLNEAIKA